MSLPVPTANTQTLLLPPVPIMVMAGVGERKQAGGVEQAHSAISPADGVHKIQVDKARMCS